MSGKIVVGDGQVHPIQPGNAELAFAEAIDALGPAGGTLRVQAPEDAVPLVFSAPVAVAKPVEVRLEMGVVLRPGPAALSLFDCSAPFALHGPGWIEDVGGLTGRSLVRSSAGDLRVRGLRWRLDVAASVSNYAAVRVLGPSLAEPLRGIEIESNRVELGGALPATAHDAEGHPFGARFLATRYAFGTRVCFNQFKPSATFASAAAGFSGGLFDQDDDAFGLVHGNVAHRIHFGSGDGTQNQAILHRASAAPEGHHNLISANTFEECVGTVAVLEKCQFTKFHQNRLGRLFGLTAAVRVHGPGPFEAVSNEFHNLNGPTAHAFWITGVGRYTLRANSHWFLAQARVPYRIDGGPNPSAYIAQHNDFDPGYAGQKVLHVP